LDNRVPLSLRDVVVGGREFLVELSVGLKGGPGGCGRAGVGTMGERGGQRSKATNNTQTVTETSRTL
jgi:hypothetical protein